MKSRNKIASIVLFLAALAVGFDAKPGWCHFNHSLPGYIQCDVAMGFAQVTGMVVLQDGTVLVADYNGLYSFRPGSTCGTSLPRLLSRYRYLGMAIGLDGQVYANDFGPLSPGNLYIVSPVTGQQISTVLTGIYGAGMALDPLTGDLYVSRCGPTACPGPDIRKISGLYGAPGGPRISTFVTVTGAEFDGLAWSCDGTRLVAASQLDEVFQFDRNARTTLDVHVPPGTTPDGVAFGAAGTPFGDYFFVNNEHEPGQTSFGSVSKIKNDGSTYEVIEWDGNPGDFVAVDTQGNLLVTQTSLVTRLSADPAGPYAGGQWVLPGSTLCSDLGCGAQAATTPQVDHDNYPCLSGFDADLVLSLSQAACGGCANCATLNQSRGTLLTLLNSLDPPATCLDPLKTTVTNLYLSCPCNCPCANCIPNASTTMSSGGTCLAQTKFPLGFDLEWYDPILQPFMRRGSSP